MPDHPGLLVLIFKNEFEFLATASVLPGSKHHRKIDHSVSRKEPVILRASRNTRWAVASGKTATEVGIADPRLIEGDFRPRQRAIDRLIRRFNLKHVIQQRRVVICSYLFQRSFALLKLFCDCTRSLLWAAGDEDSSRVIATRANGEGKSAIASKLTILIGRFIVGNDVG